jgi:hypothetical protein
MEVAEAAHGIKKPFVRRASRLSEGPAAGCQGRAHEDSARRGNQGEA